VGIVIRNKRLRKFRNKHWTYLFIVKVTTVFYVMTFSMMFLIGTTTAFFNDKETVKLPLKAVWEIENPPEENGDWDKSSLEFIGVSSDVNQISATLINGGDDMAGTVEYEVWWNSDDKNPMKGELVYDNGIVPALKHKGEHTLTFIPTKPGNYKFKAYQRPGHGNKTTGGNGNQEQVLWSGTITVVGVTNSPDTNIPEKIEPTKETTEPPEPPETPETPEPNSDVSPDVETQTPPEQTSEVEENNGDTESVEQSDAITEETQ
jgi:YqxM protein